MRKTLDSIASPSQSKIIAAEELQELDRAPKAASLEAIAHSDKHLCRRCLLKEVLRNLFDAFASLVFDNWCRIPDWEITTTYESRNQGARESLP